MKTRKTMIITLSIATFSLLLGLTIGKRYSNKSNEEVASTELQADTTKVADRIFNLIILDESGSMSGLEKASVNGVNETIQTIKAAYDQNPKQEQLLTFITFSDTGESSIRVHQKLKSIESVTEYRMENFSPNGTTPLFDAMGISLTELESSVTDNDLVLVTIITDGFENSSKEYNRDKIKELIARLDKKDWIFTYIGANQDAVLEAGRIGISNAMNFDADERGTKEMWEKEKKYRRSFMQRARVGTAKERLKRDYFEN